MGANGTVWAIRRMLVPIHMQTGASGSGWATVAVEPASPTALLRLAHPAIEGSHAHTQTLCRLTPGNITRLIDIPHSFKLRRARLAGPTKTHAARPRRRDSLRLATVDVLSFHLRHVTQQLQNDIGDQRAGHIRSAAISRTRIEQRHIQHNDGRTKFLGYTTPFLEYLAVVSTQPIDGKHHQHVAGSQDMKQFPIPRAIKVLTARTVGKDIRRLHAIGAQRIQLAIQILITRAHPRIPIYRCHNIPAFS